MKFSKRIQQQTTDPLIEMYNEKCGVKTISFDSMLQHIESCKMSKNLDIFMLGLVVGSLKKLK